MPVEELSHSEDNINNDSVDIGAAASISSMPKSKSVPEMNGSGKHNPTPQEIPPRKIIFY